MLTVEVTPRALAQLERAAAWWSAKRPAAPGAVADDFEAKIVVLAFWHASRGAEPKL